MNILSKAQISEACLTLNKSGTERAVLINQVCVSVLDHGAKHGDVSGAAELMNALPNADRKQAVLAYLRHFAGGALLVKQASDTKKWIANLKEGWNASMFDVEGASEVSYADFTKEKAAKTAGIVELIKAIKTKATNTKTNVDGSLKVSSEAREVAQLLLKHALTLPAVQAIFVK